MQRRFRCIKLLLSPCPSGRNLARSSNSRVLIQLYYSSSLLFPTTPNSNTNTNPSSQHWELEGKDVVDSFKEWFQSHHHRNNNNNPLADKVFDALRQTEDDVCLSLSNLGLRLSETVVLDILNYTGGGKDVLSCLKFFDWAGRQSGYHHTRATFSAIFNILSNHKLMSLMLHLLHNYTNQRFIHKVRFYNTLVMGYAVAGKPEVSLQLFGRMRGFYTAIVEKDDEIVSCGLTQKQTIMERWSLKFGFLRLPTITSLERRKLAPMISLAACQDMFWTKFLNIFLLKMPQGLVSYLESGAFTPTTNQRRPSFTFQFLTILVLNFLSSNDLDQILCVLWLLNSTPSLQKLVLSFL